MVVAQQVALVTGTAVDQEEGKAAANGMQEQELELSAALGESLGIVSILPGSGCR